MVHIGIHFGLLCPLLREQLKDYNIDEDDLMHFQLDADAIARLKVRGVIPDYMAAKARDRLLAKIAKSIK